MSKLDGLSPNTEQVLNALIDEFGKDYQHGLSPADWRKACRELIEDDFLVIVQRGDKFTLRITPLGHSVAPHLGITQQDLN